MSHMGWGWMLPFRICQDPLPAVKDECPSDGGSATKTRWTTIPAVGSVAERAGFESAVPAPRLALCGHRLILEPLEPRTGAGEAKDHENEAQGRRTGPGPRDALNDRGSDGLTL